MTIERTNNEVIFRVSGSVKIDDLQDIADRLEYSEIAVKSKATQKQADLLAASVKKGRWAKNSIKIGR